MRTADTELSIIRDRGKRGLPLERVTSLLYNRDLYLRAYARLYPNRGALTPGSTTETVDGMSVEKIDRLITALRDRTFRWTPVRRVTIPKANGTQRPLGVPTWSDKLLQEVMRDILEAYYEPQFSEYSHGFRPPGKVRLKIPGSVKDKAIARYTRTGKSIHRPELLENSDYDIVLQYQAEYRGLVQYYRPASNIGALSYLRWIMEQSLLKTLANKHKTTVQVMRRKYLATTTTEGRSYKCLEVRVERGEKRPLIARFGGIPLKCQPFAVLDDYFPPITNGRTEVIQRLQANTCELCGETSGIEVHHIRKLANLQKRYRGRVIPTWVEMMAKRRRKTLVVCRKCHSDIHGGRYDRNEPLASRMR